MKDKESSDAFIGKHYNAEEFDKRLSLSEELFETPIPRDELMNNIAVYLDRRTLSRFLFINELYQYILEIHGSIFEFGVRYGQNISLLTSLRGIYEPYNYNRRIVGFDTWEGFPKVSAEDDSKTWEKGDFSVPKNYEIYLDKIISQHEAIAPIENIKKFELIKGDATKTIDTYLKEHPETIISFAYFDFDLYEPTKHCLNAILPYLSKGAVIAFDEINVKEWPGETQAFREVFGNKFKVCHSKFRANAGYIIYD